ncbi:hypothetical protein ACFGW0_01940 [Pasteurella multocida]
MKNLNTNVNNTILSTNNGENTMSKANVTKDVTDVNKNYAGIGSREIPERVRESLMKIAARMGNAGWTLHTGDADGADAAFRLGCGRHTKRVYTPEMDIPPEAYEIAQKHHPAWATLNDHVRRLMARSVMNVLGQDLNSPVAFIVAWTKKSGGTAFTMRVARTHGIIVYNLAQDNSMKAFMKWLDANTEDAEVESTTDMEGYVALINEWAGKTLPKEKLIVNGESLLENKKAHYACAQALWNVLPYKVKRAGANKLMQSNGDCQYEAVKSAVKRIFYTELMDGFNALLFKGCSNTDVIRHFREDSLPSGFSEALIYAQDAEFKLSMVFGEISTFLGFKMPISGPRVMLPVADISTGEVTERLPASEVVESIVSPRGLTVYRTHNALRDVINGVIAKKEPKLSKAWKRLNGEIAFNANAWGDVVTTQVTMEDGSTKAVNVQGSATAWTEALRERIHKMRNPVQYDQEGNMTELMPYPHDINDLEGQLDTMDKWSDRHYRAIEIRKEYEDVMRLIVNTWGSDQSPERALEAGKTHKFNMKGCFFLLNDESMADITMYSSRVFDGVAVDTPVYLKVFDDYEAPEVGEFLKDLNIHNAKQRHVNAVQERTLKQNEMRKQFGWE